LTTARSSKSSLRLLSVHLPREFRDGFQIGVIEVVIHSIGRLTTLLMNSRNGALHRGASGGRGRSHVRQRVVAIHIVCVARSLHLLLVVLSGTLACCLSRYDDSLIRCGRCLLFFFLLLLDAVLFFGSGVVRRKLQLLKHFESPSVIQLGGVVFEEGEQEAIILVLDENHVVDVVLDYFVGLLFQIDAFFLLKSLDAEAVQLCIVDSFSSGTFVRQEIQKLRPVNLVFILVIKFAD